MTLRRIILVLTILILFIIPLPTLAQTGSDYYSPETLDKPLGITRLPNGNTLIADTGGANYTTTDSAILEIDPAGEVVWVYAEPMAFAHSANPWSDDTILITDTGNDRVFRVNRAGEMVWTSDDWDDGTGNLSDGSHLDYPNDAELLANGHMLLSDRNNDRVLEVTEAGEVVWFYDQLERPHNPDRLENGHTMISDSEKNVVIEVDAAGELVWEYGGEGILNWPRDADRLENGNTLITDSRNNRIVEVTSGGEIVWEYGGLAIPYEADRLENGNTLIGDNNHKRVIEVNAAGETAWSFRNFDDTYAATLQNGGFETDADGNSLPDSWYPADLNAEGPATFIWDGNEKKSGQYSGGLEYHGSGRAAWMQTVQVTPGETYHFKGDLKTQIIGGVVAYQLWFVDDLGGPMGEPQTVGDPLTASADWTTVNTDIVAPAGATGVQIWALSVADGRVWFDNIAFGPPGGSNWALWGGIVVGALVIIGGGALAMTRRGNKG